MPLTLTDPPAATTTAVVQQVASLVSQPQPVGRRLAAAARPDLALANPHALYTATLADAAEGTVLTGAVHTTWRYLVQDRTRTIAIADATTGDSADVTHLAEGPFGPGTARAIAVAEALPQVQTGTYEVRTLQVPALNVVALWLHGDDDLFVPLMPCGAGLQPDLPYAAQDFTSALQSAAQERATHPLGAVS